jgi:hypothetical protein
LKYGYVVELGTGRKLPADLFELIEQIRGERHPADWRDCYFVAGCVEASGSFVGDRRDAETAVSCLSHRRSARGAFGSCLLTADLRQQHRGQARRSEGLENGGGRIGSMKQIVG